MQDQWTLQFFLNLIEFEMDLQRAVEVPSFHTQCFRSSFYPHMHGDETIFAEEGIDRKVLKTLQDMGHKVQALKAHSNGEVCAVGFCPDRGMMVGAASPKSEGNAYAMGW